MDVQLIEQTFLGALRALFKNHHFQATGVGLLTTAFTFLLSALAMHYRAQLHLSDQVVNQIPTFAAEFAGCVMLGLGVLLTQMDTGASAKEAAQQGAHAAFAKFKEDAPHLFAKPDDQTKLLEVKT